MASRMLVISLLLVVGIGLSVGQNAATDRTPTAAPEATSEPTSEPEVEATGEPNPEPEPEITSEPEPVSETTSEPESKGDSPFAEPVPKWDEALPLYDWAWGFHIYLMGILFALLAVYSLGSIIKLRHRRLLSYGYFVALNILMLVMGTIRALYLLVDAYNYKGIWPSVLAYLFLGTGFPCLTSAFSILFLALLQSTKTQLVPPKIQKPKYLASVIAIHFVFAFIADVVVGLYVTAAVLLLICQVCFVVWGLFLTVSYMVIFRRLYKSSVRKFREITRLSVRTSSVALPGIQPYVRRPRNNWGSAIKITLVTASLGFIIALLQVYGMVYVYGPLGGQKDIPEPWPWWSYQFVFRLLEFLMCALMSYVATQPFRYTKDGKEKPSSCAPCWDSLCEMFGRRKELTIQQEEEYNSHVWSSAFEPCLPEKPTMYAGLAASNQKPLSETPTKTRKHPNTNNSSVNIHIERSGSMGKVNDRDMKLEFNNGFNAIRKTRSSEVVGSEMNNRAKSPVTAPVVMLSMRPFGDAMPNHGQVVKNELRPPVSDKVTNCHSSPISSSNEKEPILNDSPDVSQTEIQSPTDSDKHMEFGDEGEMIPLNPLP